MKLIAYKVKNDSGFAPNPYFGVLTLATCKPKIRSSSNVHIGDWIAGWTAASSKYFPTPFGEEKLVYLARISNIIPIEQYWYEYPQKRPDFSKPKSSPEYYGDNIYEPDPLESYGFKRVDSHFHCTEENKKHDLGGKNVIICKEFYYFSAEKALEIPYDIRNGFNNDQRGHRDFEDEEKIESFIKFVKSNKNICKYWEENSK